MSFLAPLVLSGLAAAGVPVLIHLLNKFRVNHTDWGAMRFLHDAVHKNQRKVKLDELILLVMRCMLIALAVFAFARPALKGLGVGEGEPVAAVVLLDHSASMAQSAGAMTRFEQSKAGIRAWLDKQNSQSLVGLYLAGERTVPLIAKPENDFALFRRSLDGAQVSDDGGDLSQALRLAVDSLKTISGRSREILIHTDGQAGALRRLDEMKLLARENPDITIKVITGDTPPPDNLGIVSLKYEGGVPSVSQPVLFRAEVLNSGKETLKNVSVAFTLDDKFPAGSAIIPTIAPGETQPVSMSVNFPEASPHFVTAQLPPDGFAADNKRTCALEVADRMDVAIVEGDTPQQPSGGFFLSHALVPVSADQAARYFLAPSFVRIADLTAMVSLQGPDRPELVFLCEPAGLGAKGADALEAYVKSGGNLVVFPGSSVELGAKDTPEVLTRLLPGTLGPTVEVAANETPKAWQSDGFNHQITSFWNETSHGNLGAVRFTRYAPLSLKPDASVKTVAVFADGQASLVEWPVGRGCVMLSGANLDREWTNLALHPAFVPLIQRMVGFLHQRTTPKLNLSPGEPFRMSVSEDLDGKDYSVRAPGSDSARTAGRIATDDRGTFIRHAATDKSGIYQVMIGQDAVSSFAVGIDAAESDLRPADDAAITALSEIPRTTAKGADARMVVKKEYWTLLISCAAALFLVEAVMAHRMSYAR